ncbi:MAG TPA: M20/M25/M40 family metallo-hydrolase [Chitinophagaceae bacterium]|nr:M20/M25/M40 family metallo-hydrolase [Chitinophagaceae bacterium]
MKRSIVLGLLITTTFFVFGQNKIDIINAKEVERIEKVLSADEMRGRKTFSLEIDKAADFISDEFKKAGLQVCNTNEDFKQKFSLIQAKPVSLSALVNGEVVNEKNLVVVSSKPGLTINERSGYEKININAGANLFREARNLIQSGKNLLVLVDSSHASNFARLTGLKRGIFKSDYSVVFMLTGKDPSSFSIEVKQGITEQPLVNVLGILPGTTKKEEVVVFSAHYDHIGVGKAVDGDSIYNGANDDAAGTTAVIMLAKYFKALGNNERTIVFVAFTAEEVGGFGSQYFSRQLDAEKVVAMFNIEMIGTESKWGKNAAFVTGFDKTDMVAIMQKNLQGTGFTFHPDPYPEQNLFYRSDNATLARLGVPAHTISTAKMENEPHYHKVTDEIETLDIENMTQIIKSIALSSKTIVSGKDTPTRVKVEELR